jgi:hypothetical protein
MSAGNDYVGWIRPARRNGKWVPLIAAGTEADCWAALAEARGLRAPWVNTLLVEQTVLRRGEHPAVALRQRPGAMPKRGG